MRSQIELQTGWWVSVSEKDARLAAGQTRWQAGDLDLAGDPENHPQKIALPGGWEYRQRIRPGLRRNSSPDSVLGARCGAS